MQGMNNIKFANAPQQQQQNSHIISFLIIRFCTNLLPLKLASTFFTAEMYDCSYHYVPKQRSRLSASLSAVKVSSTSIRQESACVPEPALKHRTPDLQTEDSHYTELPPLPVYFNKHDYSQRPTSCRNIVYLKSNGRRIYSSQ